MSPLRSSPENSADAGARERASSSADSTDSPSPERSELHRLAKLHGEMVYRLAWRVCRNRDDAEDVAQEVFVKFVEARRRASIHEPRAWLAVTALNTAKNLLRHESNRRKRQEEFAERSTRERTSKEDAADREEAVWRAIDALPTLLRFPLLLHYQEGLKYREIASALDCPEGTVATRISQAKAQVQALLERNGALKS